MTETSYFSLLLAFVAAFIITCTCIFITKRIALKYNRLKKKQQHTRNRSYQFFSGIIILISVTVLAIWMIPNYYLHRAYGFALGALLITLFGFLADTKKINPKLQLLSQILSACLLYCFGIKVHCVGGFFGLEGVILDDFISFPATILWIVVIVNAFALTRRLVGLTIGLSMIASICIAYMAFTKEQYIIALLLVIVAGSSAGFFPYSTHFSKGYIGNSGAQLLGFCLATVVLMDAIPIKGAMAIALLIPILVLILTTLSKMISWVRKTEHKQPNDFIYRKIIRIGYGYKNSMALVYCISAIMGIVATLYNERYIIECLGLCAIVLMLFYILVSDPNSKSAPKKPVKAKDEN